MEDVVEVIGMTLHVQGQVDSMVEAIEMAERMVLTTPLIGFLAELAGEMAAADLALSLRMEALRAL